MHAAGLRGKNKESLALGSFFGATGSPIQAPNKHTAMDTSGNGTDSSSGDEMPRNVQERSPMDKKMAYQKGGKMSLDRAKEANIPLYAQSPMFAVPPVSGINNAYNPKILPARKTQNQHINFNEMTLGRGIGEGAFGKVYEGKWKSRPVAIKLLICQDLSAEILAEFESEVQIMSVLR